MPETAAPMRAPARAARSAYQFVEAVIAATLWSVPLLGTAAFAFGGVRALWIRTEPLLAVTLAEEATRFLDTPVAVRRVTLKPGAIELHGVRVAEPSIGRQAKQSRELLGVDRITIPLPGDLVSRLSDGQHPLVDSVLVEGARGHLRRDARGRWNFEYLIRPSEGPPARNWVAEVRVVGATIWVRDAAMIHHADRPNAEVGAVVHRLSGRLLWDSPGTMSWLAEASPPGQTMGALSSTGRYHSASGVWLAGIRASEVAWPRWASRFLPAGFQVDRASVSGSVILCGGPTASQTRQGVQSPDITADAHVSGALVKTPWLRRPVSLTGSRLRLRGESLAAYGTGRFLGTPGRIHVRVDGFGAPTYSVQVSADRVRLRDALRDIVAATPYRESLAGLEAHGALTGVIAGTGSPPPRVSVHSVLTCGAAPISGVVIARPARVEALLSGPLSSPTLRFAGDAPRARAMDFTVSGVRFRGVMANGDLDVAGRMRLAGGAVVARGHARLDGRTPYSGSVSLRGVNVAQLAAEFDASRFGRIANRADRKVPGGRPAVTGLASADLRVAGDRDRPVRHAAGMVQVLGVNIDGNDLDELELTGRISGDSAQVQRAIVRRGDAVALARGHLNFRSSHGELDVEADAWPLTAVVGWTGYAPDTHLGGTLSLRSGRVSGDLRRPGLQGTVYAQGLQIGEYAMDYAVGAVEGSFDGLAVDVEAVRVPAVVTLTGFIRKPFSGDPWMSAVSHVRDVDLNDVGAGSNSGPGVSGLVSGDLVINGPMSALEVSEYAANAPRLRIGDVTLQDVNVAGSARQDDGAYAVDIGRATAGIESGALSASGHFKTDGTFDISVRADAVPLEALSSLTAGYADLRGVADGDAAIVGLRAEQDDVHTTGRISVQTTGLRVNGQDVGDLRAALAMNGRTLSGVATDGPPLALGQEPGRAVVSDITYDLDSRRFAVVGSLSGMDLDAIRRIVERSPTVMAGEAAEPLSRAMAALAPITGRFGGSASVSGTPDDWRVLATFDGAGLSLGDLRPDAFAAEVEATNRDLVMRSAELRSGDAIVSAEGELVFGERIAGLVSAQGIDFGVVSQWFPADSRARGLSGVLDTATAEITGKPSVPEVSLVASARGVSYRSPEASGGARDVTAPAIRLSGAVIREGWAGFEDLAVTLAQADGTGGRSQAPPVEVHAAGRVPFTWQSPFVAQDAVAELTVRLPETDLRSFQNLTTGGQVDMVGTVGAEVTVRGTREQAENLTEGFKAGDDRLAITGTAWLKAEQIRAFQMRTVLGDLDLRLALDGDRVSVVERPDGKPTGMFFALGSGTDPRTEAGSLILAGSLALTDPAGRPNELTIRAPRLRFDEAPFPGFGTGRVSGEVAAGAGAREEGGRRPDGVRLVVSGSVMEPSIAGSVTLKSVAMRLPVTEAAVRTKRPVPLINPKFDIGIYVPDGASVRSTLVQASLATNPSAPIRITGSLADPRVAGSLAIQSGFLNFPTARFAIRRGGLVALRYPGASSVGAEDAGLDVTVDLSAQARISAESVTGQRKRYLVTVEAKGPLLERPSDPIGGSDSRMRLTYRADPPDLALSRDGLARRVQALLGGQDALQAVFSRQGDAGGLLVGKVVDYLGGALMPDLVDQTGVGRALGLQELTVDYSRGGAFVLRLSRDLFGPFEVAYWRNLSGVRDHVSDSGDWEFRLGIRLRRGFRLTWVIDDQRTNAYRLEGVYSF